LGEGDAFVVLAFVPQTAEGERTLSRLRRHVRDATGNATILGFGPRYLHSTGQLFKGGPDRIVALVVHAPAGEDVDVPDAGYSLGELLQAQALGDVEAMRALGRRVFFVTLDSPRQLSGLAKAVEAAAVESARPIRRSR
jgi:transaldolase/glucose-6-phosphate isomerase